MNKVGKKLDKYDILEQIGRGGMGMVYKGYDPALKRTVAIKILAPHLTWEPQFVHRFLREARTVAQLSHPHIISVYDVGVKDDIYYLVMAFVEGETLGQLIAEEGVLSPERASEILVQIAEALDHAHSQGLIHRDVKPGNVLIGTEQHAVLTDFGIARAAEGTRLTATGTSMGTPEYMSPEQADGRPTDARSDVYSLGILLYEMLTGQVPFHADTPLATLRMQTDHPPPSPRLIVPSLSPEVEGVLLKALAKDPESRYTSAGLLAQALIKAIKGRLPVTEIGEPEQARMPTAERTTMHKPIPRARSGPILPAWPWVAMGLVAVVLILVGALTLVSELSALPASSDVPAATSTSTPQRLPANTPMDAPVPAAAATNSSISSPTSTLIPTATRTSIHTRTSTSTVTTVPTRDPE